MSIRCLIAFIDRVRSTNAVWTYESPYAAVAAIRNYLAFYPDRVDTIEERPSQDGAEMPRTAGQALVNKRDYNLPSASGHRTTRRR
jgi:hypothetical protein